MTSYLVHGFTFGFFVGNTVSYPNISVKNLRSCFLAPQVVSSKLGKELELGRIAGPFVHPPFPDLVVSPIGLHPKKEPNKFRMIHDLSSPHGRSINDGIPPEFASVHYQSITQAVEAIVRFGPGSFLAKSDIQSAFRLIPLHPSQYHLFGLKWQEEFYYDKCLPMGCASSCRIFESFSSALHWIVSSRVKHTAVVHVLDDFLFISPSFELCHRALLTFKSICRSLGVPLAPEKTVGPATSLPFLGIGLDTIEMQTTIPPDKITRMMADTDLLLRSKSLTLRKLQSINGLLNFACQVLPSARAFLRSLFNLTVGVPRPHYHVHIPLSAKADVLVWQEFLLHFNGLSFMLDFKFKSNFALHLYSDACTSVGFGLVFNSQWTLGRWHPDCSGLHITVLEFYPIVLALYLWGNILANKCIIFHCDNIAVVHIINTFTSKVPSISKLLRKLVSLCLKNNIFVRSMHIPGASNLTSDFLSRGQVPQARRASPWLEDRPVHVPTKWQLHRLLTD